MIKTLTKGVVHRNSGRITNSKPVRFILAKVVFVLRMWNTAIKRVNYVTGKLSGIQTIVF